MVSVGGANLVVILIQYNQIFALTRYCAAIGRMTGFASTKERIQLCHEFKQHLSLAVEIDPNDRVLHHMCGRWCHEIASLSWIERKLVATFYGEVPKATNKEALVWFHKAHSLKHDWKSNHYFLGKTYVKLKQYSEAIKWIDSGLAVPSQTEEDAVMHIELQTLEKSNAKYRQS